MQHYNAVFFNFVIRVVSTILVLTVLSINFCEKFVSRHRWVMIASSVLSVYLVVLTGEFIKLCIQKYVFTSQTVHFQILL